MASCDAIAFECSVLSAQCWLRYDVATCAAKLALSTEHSALSMILTRRDIESLVEQALAELPPQFKNLLDNIAIVVEEEPTDDDLDVLEDPGEGDELLGLYRGVALTHRTHDMLPMLPDQIAIFRGPIMRVAASRRDVVDEVRDTVIHELGHYFGLHDDDMVF